MYTWIAYDISSNKARRKIALSCKRLGLTRIQKSNFLGKVKKRYLHDFEQTATSLINPKTDKIYLLPITKEMYQNMIRYGLDFDSERIEASIRNIFF